MDIERMREFCILADTFSFNETARYFYLSQSVLSKHIASMEEELQAKLFVRDSHHVRLTEQGRSFKRDADAIIAQYEGAVSRLSALNDAYRANVSIGYVRNASRPFLAQFVKIMKRRYPDIRLSLRCMEVGEGLYKFSTNALDIMFTMDFWVDADESYEKIVIYEDHFDAIVGPGHPLASLESVTSDLLHGCRLLLPDESAYANMSGFVHSLLPSDVDTSHCEVYRDVDTLYLKVETEDYVGFSSEHNMKLFSDKVRFLPITDRQTAYNVCAFASKSRANEATAACFEALAECARLLRQRV